MVRIGHKNLTIDMHRSQRVFDRSKESGRGVADIGRRPSGSVRIGD